MILEEITMPQFFEGLNKTRTVIVPYGSVEEHGSHLPLSTDTVHIYEMAKAVSRKRPVFVALPIHYGLCRSTSKHPGTVSVTSDTLRRLTTDIVKSLHLQGMRNFVLVSGHAGNTHMATIINAGEELLDVCPDARIAVLSVFDLMDDFPHGLVETPEDSHAGEVETSAMLFLRPDWVCGTSPEDYPSFPKSILVRDKRRYWESGVWGDPSKASVEKGKRLFDLLVNNLIRLVDKLERFSE